MRSHRRAVIGWVVLFGCSGSGATTSRSDGATAEDAGSDPFGISFAKEVFPIVARSCAIAGCHDTPTLQNHWSNFSTTAYTYQRWVNGPGTDFCVDPPEAFLQRTIVIPGDPEGSFVVMKIRSTREELCQSNHYPRMPPPQFPALAPAEIQTIASWIREGARDN